MDLLILGGTRFLGRHLAALALASGHRVTLLHRGLSAPDLFPAAEHLIADRDGDLAVLAGRTWDAAIDTSAYVPRQVRAVVAALGGRLGHYGLVSTISVYAGFDGGHTDEGAPLAILEDPDAEVVDSGRYGGLKALCEQAAHEGFGPRCLVARPGLLVGPHDPTGRFTWWVQRLARAATEPGRPVLAPGDAAAPAQYLDARDAAAWLLSQAERGGHGVFNLTGPASPTTLGAVLETTRRMLAPDAILQWVDETFLLAQGVAPWTELPLWLPAAQAGLHRIDSARALAAGLVCRPLAETVADTRAWCGAQPAAAAAPAGGPLRPRVGLAPEREARLLAGRQAAGTAA